MTKKIRLIRTEVYEYEVDLQEDPYCYGASRWTESDGTVHEEIPEGSVDNLEKAIEVDRYYIYEIGTMPEDIAGMSKKVEISFEVFDDEA
jgi:hypothetical protein